jgi:hypothetical protein
VVGTSAPFRSWNCHLWYLYDTNSVISHLLCQRLCPCSGCLRDCCASPHHAMIEWILYYWIRVGWIKGIQLPHLKEWSWSSSEGHMQLKFFVSDPVIQCLCCAHFVTSCQNINPSLMWRIATIRRVLWEQYKLFDTKL